MYLVKIGVAALNQIPLDWRGNSDRIIHVLQQARKEGVQFLGLPEMALSGYGCEDAYFSPSTSEQALAALEALLPHTQGLITNFDLPLRFQGALFNGNVVVADGEIIGIVPKKYLAGDGVHYEPRWFKEWPIGFADVIPSSELSPKEKLYQKDSKKKTKPSNENTLIPIGDLAFQWKDLRFGYEICEEAWVAQRPGSTLAKNSVDIIFNPSASHFSFGKNEIRKRFVLEGSRAFACVYAYSNLLGNEAGRLIYDGSLLIASNGEMIHESKRFSFADSQMIVSVVDLDINRTKRLQTSSFNPIQNQSARAEKSSKGFKIISINNQNLFNKSQSTPQRVSSPEVLPPLTKNEEFLHAVSLGLFDYVRKSGNYGFAISISGGTDSSVVAVLAVDAIRLAFQELGLKKFLKNFSYIKSLQGEVALENIVTKMVHGVYQSTQNSSKETRDAAFQLAKALHITFSEWSVEAIKEQYEKMVGSALGKTLTWAQDDLALQNIQARVRAPGIWLLANLKGFLLLATSNRSEAAVGYATMDGDTAGGLSPIAGVDKAFLNQWVRWRGETIRPNNHSYSMIPELKFVFDIPPTAELRPTHYQQQDEKDLMPYPLLDFIERHLLIDRLRPRDLMHVLIEEFPQHSHNQLCEWLVLFLKLWTRHQWKRERFAPSFHLDSVSLDPKTWCRFPILSKSFELDIEQLLIEFKN